METYPIAIVEDRYNGVYSGGRWLAIVCATDIHSGSMNRIDSCLDSDDGPSGSDIDAAGFWVEPPSWIAVGNTPEEALSKLRDTLK